MNPELNDTPILRPDTYPYATRTQGTKDARDAANWRTLMELAGHWQDGSEEPVTLWQDDATRTCGITVGRNTSYGRRERSYCVDRSGFGAAIAEARKALA